MLFSSLTFLCAFVPLFLCVYFAARRIRTKNYILLCFSLLFYAWGEPLYVFLMAGTIAANWYAAVRIEAGAHKKLWAAAAVALDLGLLCVFKYASTAVSALNYAAGASLSLPDIALPIGISFYTFQTVSYVVDVYRGDTAAQRNILYLGAYVCAFPQLIAGPIVRYTDVARELECREESAAGFARGARRFIVGLGKKVLIANTVAAVADSLYALEPSEVTAAGAWLAAISYSVQLYFDFSGYSDMAIGLGKMMGFNYPENFNYPYAASSVRDFWRRWHMTLSSFFRDYVYIPMGGSRVSIPRWTLNMLAVWLLTGIWHGAGATFALWGLYYGVLLILEKLVFARLFEKFKPLGHIAAALSFIFGWVLFRADTVADAWGRFAAMFGAYPAHAAETAAVLQRCGVGGVFLAALAVGIALSFPIFENVKKRLEAKPNAVCDACLLLMLGACLLSLACGAYNPFIYFRF